MCIRDSGGNVLEIESVWLTPFVQCEWLITEDERHEIAAAVAQKKDDTNLRSQGPVSLRETQRTEGTARAMEPTLQMLKRSRPSSSSKTLSSSSDRLLGVFRCVPAG